MGDRAVLSHHGKAFLKQYPQIVQAGPFSGMEYVSAAVGSYHLYKLIGSYEAVLHPGIDALRSEEFDTVVDIGSAEGYYLIGFGRMFPRATLIGFEPDPEGQVLTKSLYAKNALTNTLQIFGAATAQNVAQYITDNTLLVCDCEGAEIDILDPHSSPQLLKVQCAIIELHDFIRPGTKETLIARFSETHHIESISFRVPDKDAYPYLKDLDERTATDLLERERGWKEQEWLILRRK